MSLSFPLTFPFSFIDSGVTDVYLIPVDLTKGGIADLSAHAYCVSGDSAGEYYFSFPNDGRVILVVLAGIAPKPITFVPRLNPYQRIETLIVTPEANKTAMYGPFNPDNWADPYGRVKFQPVDGGDSGDKYLALRIPAMISL